MELKHIESDATIENSSHDVADNQTSHLLCYGFSIGSLNFIYDAKIACQLVQSVAVYPVPNTPTWMMGLINLHGGLVPVFNLEKYFDFQEEADQRKLLLVLGEGEKAVAFQLKKYPQLLNNLTKLDSLPKLNPKIDDYVVAAYRAEKIWLQLDKDNFFTALGKKVCV